MHLKSQKSDNIDRVRSMAINGASPKRLAPEQYTLLGAGVIHGNGRCFGRGPRTKNKSDHCGAAHQKLMNAAPQACGTLDAAPPRYRSKSQYRCRMPTKNMIGCYFILLLLPQSTSVSSLVVVGDDVCWWWRGGGC